MLLVIAFVGLACNAATTMFCLVWSDVHCFLCFISCLRRCISHRHFFFSSSHTGSLLNTALSLDTNVAGATGNAHMQFTLNNPLSVGDFIRITLPTGFQASTSAISPTVCSSVLSPVGASFLSTTVSGQVVTCMVGSIGDDSSTATVWRFSLSNITNPAASQAAIKDMCVYTVTNGGRSVMEATCDGTIPDIVPGKCNSVYVSATVCKCNTLQALGIHRILSRERISTCNQAAVKCCHSFCSDAFGSDLPHCAAISFWWFVCL